MSAARLSWPPIVARAVEIVNEYDTSVTLRQLFLPARLRAAHHEQADHLPHAQLPHGRGQAPRRVP